MDEREWQEYMEMVAIIEARPENQSWADKTWVEETERAFNEHFKKARESGEWIRFSS